MHICLLHSIIRPEEKYLIKEIEKRGHDLMRIDDRELVLDFHEKPFETDVVLERCINHSRALASLKIFEDYGIPTVNTYKTAEICGSKLWTSSALVRNKIPTPKVGMAFTPKSAIELMKKIGFPCVLKPAIGSWGRLISKVNDIDAAETILEHKQILGTYHHSIFYVQEYIEKQGKDIRAFVIGNETIAAIYRKSEHWITNTARGGKASNLPVTDELNEICLKAAEAVGGGVVAVDVFETENGFLINEVNYTMEFRNSIEPTGINIPGKIIDYVEEYAKS